MSWEMPLLEEVIVEDTKAGFETLAEGKYVFQLQPATNFDATKNRLNIAVAIADGDSKGRRIFPTLPKPKSKSDWPNQVLKRIAEATGSVAIAGEGPETFLNRVATNGHAKFGGRVYHRTYTKNDGTVGVSAELDFRSISPAA